MIKHYLIIAVRNLCKYKVQNLIGIIGMAIGITFFTIGYNWLEYETSYDGFHPDSKHIYQIYGIDKQTGKKKNRLPMVLADKLIQEFPEVEKTTMIYNNFSAPITYNDKKLGYPDFKFVDEHFFELFPPIIIAGKSEHLLYTSEELVVTEDFARKHWQSPEKAVGEVLKENAYDQTLTIVAVMKNPPANSNFHAEGFRPDIFDRGKKGKRAVDKEWFLMEQQIFVLFKKKVDINAFQEKLQYYAIENKYNENLILKVTNITDVRYALGSDLSFNISYIHTFVGAGLLLMFCVLFNFLNLFVNRMLLRSREIKLRTTLGSNKFSIIKLLQTEILAQLLLIFIAGAILLSLTAPIFENYFETQINLYDLFVKYIIISFITFILISIICLFTEIKFSHLTRLTHLPVTTANYKLFRNITICVQLGICVFFLMCAFVFYRQVSLMNNFDWGFKKEGMIKVTIDAENIEEINQDIARLPFIKEYVQTRDFYIKREPVIWRDGGVEWEGKPKDVTYTTMIFDVSDVFLKGFEIPLIEGRDFQESDITDIQRWGYTERSSNKVLVTQSLAKLMNKENVIGEKIEIPMGIVFEDGTRPIESLEIIGVIKDFHTTGLQNPLYPVIIKCTSTKSDWKGYCNYVKVDNGMEEKAIVSIKEIFKRHARPGDPEYPEVESLELLLNNMNKSENASLQLFSVLAVLCIVIAIFGIYSISSLNMERRKKEIAIRKVSGARAEEIVRMFLLEYAKMIFIANLIALPLAFYFMHNWLMQYAFKIGIGFWMFLLVFAFSLGIVILTVISQVINAANRNPAEVIKSE